MNTETVNNGIEVYIHKLFSLADEYVETRLKGKEENVPDNFRDMIFYMADRLEKPDNNDLESLDNLFQSYVRLCVKYNKLPTVQAFSWLAKIHRSTFNDWENGVYRSNTPRYADTIKEWKEICKSFVIDELTNNSTTNVNLIFVSKACYGLRETSPTPPEEPSYKRVLSLDELPKLDLEESEKQSEILPRLDI